jgi:hypothetical protein
MSDVRSRGRPRKILLISVALFAVVLAVFVAWCWATAHLRWNEMVRKIEALDRELEAMPKDRPVLRGAPLEGNAWDDYWPALGSLTSIRWYDPGWKAVSGFSQGQAGADRALVAATVEAHRSSLMALQLGARRAQGAPRVRRHDGNPLHGDAALQALVQCQARLLDEAGNSREAAELLLDLGQFAQDYSRIVRLYSRSTATMFLDSAINGLHRVVLDGGLSGDELLEVSRQLEVLDRSAETVVTLEPGDVVALGFEFINANDLSAETHEPGMCRGGECSRWGAWRFGFSARLMAADAVEEALRRVKEAEAFRSAPWSELQKFEDLNIQRLLRERNPVVRSHVFPLCCMKTGFLQVRARLRLLRIACKYRAIGEILDLPDPFGARLMTRKDGPRLKLWSVGRDGVDDGGIGSWKADSRDKDLVLELDR